MTRNRLHKTVFTLIGMTALAASGFAEGKHGGDKHGDHGEQGDRGDHGNRGQEKKQRDNDDRGGGPGDRGNALGRKRGDDGQAAFREQQRQQRQQFEQAREQQRVQQQNVWNAERRQRQNQRQAEWNARAQQQAYRRQIQNQNYDYDDRSNRGQHKGWSSDGPRGNAYVLRGVRPGEVRRDRDRYDRSAQPTPDRRYPNSTIYNSWNSLPNYYPAYGQNTVYNRQPSREYIVRSPVSSYYAPRPAYDRYSSQPVYYPQSNYAGEYYSPADSGQYLGGNSLKSSLLSVGLQLLQGFMG